jgi:hypothetical protein
MYINKEINQRGDSAKNDKLVTKYCSGENTTECCSKILMEKYNWYKHT